MKQHKTHSGKHCVNHACNSHSNSLYIKFILIQKYFLHFFLSVDNLNRNTEKQELGSLKVTAWDLTRMMHKLNEIDEAVASLKEIRDIYKKRKTEATNKTERHANGSVTTYDNPTYR